MTLPPRPQDWPPDARHEWLERVGMRLEQWGGKAAPDAERHAEREAEAETRQRWQGKRR